MESGDTIGKYRLVDRLGRGGMGEVWLATASGDRGFAKDVVLKTLLPELDRDPLFVEMLAHEARVCARLNHPNLIEVFDFSEHDGVYLLAMEHVVGRPLNHIMKAASERGWQLPAWFALRVAWECCRGLESAHAQGVIHCDLSPSNVMVTFTGVTKILDFGVAHSMTGGTKADRLKGKFPYMAPERIKSLATDRRTDVYALGVMLYLLFTGRLPFTATSDAELLRRIVREPVRPPSEVCPVDPRIEQIILRAIQPAPAARYQTISDMLAALSPCLDGQLGAYGQRDAAALVCTLFEVPTSEPPARTRDDAVEDEAIVDLDSFDVDIESSVLEIDRELPPVARPLPTPLVTGARGSSSMRPRTKPLIDVLAEAEDPPEPRTSVQSLFEGRPALGPGATSAFGRTMPGVPDPERAPREPPRGVFGETAPPGRATATRWPWPSSRTKAP